MSRIIIFGLDGSSAGELQANCSRGWAINAGDEAKVRLTAPVPSFLDFGRMALVEHPQLPAWAGMIDTPWTASVPCEMKLYSAGYLLSIRTPDVPLFLKGTAAEIAAQLLEKANAQEDTGIRMGETEDEDRDREENFDLRPFWEQLVALAKRAGMEMRVRAGRDGNNRLALSLDMKKKLGVATGFLLHDGEGANIEVVKAEVDGQIFNRVTGFGDQSGKVSRVTYGPALDEDSASRWRLRSTNQQFAGVTVASTLERNTLTALAVSKQPYLKLSVNALDVGETFQHLDLGNTVVVHTSRIQLPGGAQGWTGEMRMTALDFDEDKNAVGMLLEASL